MKEKYAIQDDIFITILQQEYGLHLEAIHFIPVGDSAYSYLLHGEKEQKYYLKLFDHQNSRQRNNVVRLAHYLPVTYQIYHQQLFRQLTFPLKNNQSQFMTTLEHFTIVLFHYIEGETLAEAYPFSKQILEEIAEIMATIHGLSPHIDSSILIKESYDLSFVPELAKGLRQLEGLVDSEEQLIQSLRENLWPRKEQIYELCQLLGQLRETALREKKEQVLCHGDMWGGNLIRKENKLYVLDWEAAMLAPPEYDLFSYVGQQFEVFFSAYQQKLGYPVNLDANLLRFYSYRHHLRNLSHWLTSVLDRKLETVQRENDLEMIVDHCLDRLDKIEPMLNK